jgi:hypothetical protein
MVVEAAVVSKTPASRTEDSIFLENCFCEKDQHQLFPEKCELEPVPDFKYSVILKH